MKKLKHMCKGFSAVLLVILLEILMVVPVYASEVTGAADVTQAASASGTPAAKELDLNGKYHAALGIQTCDTLWIGRWGYYDAGINPQFGTDKYSVLFSGSDSAKNYKEYPGTFTDATIEGNGTYTVSLKGADFADEKDVSQLHIATDIPDNDKIKFSNVTVKVNDNTLATYDEGYIETEKKYLAGGMVALTINHWRQPLEDLNTGKGLTLSDNGGVVCLTGSGNDNIEITFTVSGFAYDNKATAVSAVPTVAAADNNATDSTADTKTSNSSMVVVIIVVAVVVVVAAVGAIIAVNKKKKK